MWQLLGLISVLGYWVLLLFFTTHTSLSHTRIHTHHCTRQPITTSISSYCLHLRHSACVAMVITDAPPHTLSRCLFQYEDEADLWLVMQAGCRRHHFPWEGGLFLPLGTKHTKLPNIFMEPHLIRACQENIHPHTLHLCLSPPSTQRNTVSFKAYFIPSTEMTALLKVSYNHGLVSALDIISLKGNSRHILTLHRDIRGQWLGTTSLRFRDSMDVSWFKATLAE